MSGPVQEQLTRAGVDTATLAGGGGLVTAPLWMQNAEIWMTFVAVAGGAAIIVLRLLMTGAEATRRLKDKRKNKPDPRPEDDLS